MEYRNKKKIVIGLGNPGQDYEDTYHNVGQLALAALRAAADSGSGSWHRHKDLFEYAETETAIFIRPLTYMNDSGRAVREALKKFSAAPADLTLIHDDSDIIIGNYKKSLARSSAGHNGVQSVIDALHTNAFTRIRIGIRPMRERQRKKAGEFALVKITPGNRKLLNAVFRDVISSLHRA